MRAGTGRCAARHHRAVRWDRDLSEACCWNERERSSTSRLARVDRPLLLAAGAFTSRRLGSGRDPHRGPHRRRTNRCVRELRRAQAAAARLAVAKQWHRMTQKPGGIELPTCGHGTIPSLVAAWCSAVDRRNCPSSCVRWSTPSCEQAAVVARIGSDALAELSSLAAWQRRSGARVRPNRLIDRGRGAAARLTTASIPTISSARGHRQSRQHPTCPARGSVRPSGDRRRHDGSWRRDGVVHGPGLRQHRDAGCGRGRVVDEPGRFMLDDGAGAIGAEVPRPRGRPRSWSPWRAPRRSGRGRQVQRSVTSRRCSVRRSCPGSGLSPCSMPATGWAARRTLAGSLERTRAGPRYGRVVQERRPRPGRSSRRSSRPRRGWVVDDLREQIRSASSRLSRGSARWGSPSSGSRTRGSRSGRWDCAVRNRRSRSRPGRRSSSRPSDRRSSRVALEHAERHDVSRYGLSPHTLTSGVSPAAIGWRCAACRSRYSSGAWVRQRLLINSSR